jgi:hypothetical protein
MGVIFTALYITQLPFFERYKAFSDPWPWKEDFAKWKSLMMQTALLISFNLLLLIPAIGFSQVMIGVPVNLDFGLDTVPTVPRFIA